MTQAVYDLNFSFQTNAPRNQDFAQMEEHVNQYGHPPDVTVLIVTKETGVINVPRGSREMVARNV